MKRLFISFIAVMITAGLLSACTYSQRKDVGMVAGGVAGGVIGSAVTRGSTAGTIVGAVGGAYVGRQLAK